MGLGLPVQTAVNSRLRHAADSPLFASLINFAVGTAFLWTLLLITGSLGALAAAGSAGTSWWMWCGGTLGFVFLTANILLFPQLGSVETAIWPVAGQILMALALDAGGWLGTPRRSLSVVRGLGALLVIGRVLGGTDVFLTSVLVPLIGTGMAMVLALIGQVTGSVCVDHLGWRGAARDRVVPLQVLGLLVMVAGAVLVRRG